MTRPEDTEAAIIKTKTIHSTLNHRGRCERTYAIGWNDGHITMVVTENFVGLRQLKVWRDDSTLMIEF